MTGTAAERVRDSRWRRIWLVLIFGLLLLLVLHSALDVWAGYRLQAQVARLEARYGSLNEDTLRLRPVPPDDNRAHIVRAAAALVVTGADVNRIYQFLNREPSLPVPPEIRAFAETNRPAVSMAGEIRTRTQSNWEIEPRDDGNQPNWLDIRTLSTAIHVTALLELEAGRADEAAKMVTVGLAIAASVGQEWSLLPQLVRVAIAVVQFEAVEQVIVRSEPSKAALEDLARWLRETRDPNPMYNGLVGGMKSSNGVLKTLETGGHRNLGTIADNAPFWTTSPGRLVGRPFFRLARVRYLQHIERLLDLQTGPRPRPVFALPSARSWDVPGRLAETFLTGQEHAVRTGDLFSSALSATEIGVALRRYRLDFGRYPDDLSALSPSYLATVPIDPFTGKPPVYARRGSGFTLHAEGGRVDSPIKSAHDWTVEK